MQTLRNHFSTVSCFAVAATLLTPLHASARWHAVITGGDNYLAEWTQIPDFDQVRYGLPNDGNMYCVPTAAFNMMTYIANHGYPLMAPGDDHSYFWWQSQAALDQATSYIWTMGNYMGTDPVDGTFPGPTVSGLEAWLPYDLIVASNFVGNGAPPSSLDLGDHMLHGHLVMPIVGWYNTNDFPSIYRGGGHAVTLTKIFRTPDTLALTFRDPANEQADPATQSPFQSHTYQMTRHNVNWQGSEPMVLDKVLDYGSGYLDGFCAIIPIFGLSQTDDQLQAVIINPNDYAGGLHNLYEMVDSPSGLIHRTILHPKGHWIYMLTNDDKIWRYDRINPDMTQIVSLPSAGDGDMAFSRQGHLYVIGGRTLYRILIDDLGNGAVDTGAVLGLGIETIAADDVNDSMLILNPDDQEILRVNYEVTSLLETIEVPDVPFLGRSTMAVSPVDGTIFLTSRDAGAIYELEKISDDYYMPIAFGDGVVEDVTGLNVADDGQVIASCNGIIKVFRKQDGLWEENYDHVFSELEAHGALSVPYSRTNYDPAIHDENLFRTELPTEFAPGELDCDGDLDADGDTDQADLGILLASYGQDSGGDLDGDGDTDQADLGTLLGAYGCEN